jgi:hypothetical protein
MSEFFASGHVVDVILVVLVLEVAVLTAWRRSRSLPPTMVNVVLAALPGVFLLLALRAAQTGASWMWIAACLAASFPAHLADLWRRPP